MSTHLIAALLAAGRRGPDTSSGQEFLHTLMDAATRLAAITWACEMAAVLVAAMAAVKLLVSWHRAQTPTHPGGKR